MSDQPSHVTCKANRQHAKHSTLSYMRHQADNDFNFMLTLRRVVMWIRNGTHIRVDLLGCWGLHYIFNYLNLLPQRATYLEKNASPKVDAPVFQSTRHIPRPPFYEVDSFLCLMVHETAPYATLSTLLDFSCPRDPNSILEVPRSCLTVYSEPKND